VKAPVVAQESLIS